MAFSAHKDEESIKEHFEDAKSIDKKATELVALIKAAKRVVFFTGAGISTSAGIPDFRGPDGVWTLQAQGKSRTGPTVSTTKAMPTLTHMSLVELQNRGILNYLISQNCDGLHRRSGILPEKISELHGNTNLEYCSKCKKEYLRDYSASASYRFSVHDHRTGRMCVAPGCGAPLLDSIINFGENLPEVPLQRAMDRSKESDLHIVLGSSLTVSPACNLPKSTAKNGGKLIICNLQNTPLDSYAHMRIYCRTDDLMRAVMQKLDLPVPRFILSRRIILTQQNDSVSASGSPPKEKKKGEPQLMRFEMKGVDVDGTAASIIAGIQLHVNGTAAPLMEVEPFVFELEDPDKDLELKMKLYWHGHYNEPPLTVNYRCKNTDKPLETLIKLGYDPLTGEWTPSAEAGVALSFEQDKKQEKKKK